MAEQTQTNPEKTGVNEVEKPVMRDDNIMDNAAADMAQAYAYLEDTDLISYADVTPVADDPDDVEANKVTDKELNAKYESFMHRRNTLPYNSRLKEEALRNKYAELDLEDMTEIDKIKEERRRGIYRKPNKEGTIIYDGFGRQINPEPVEPTVPAELVDKIGDAEPIDNVVNQAMDKLRNCGIKIQKVGTINIHIHM